jgi:branched-chain amino acid aminotransferase
MMTIASEHAWHNGEIVAREVGAPSIASVNFHLGTSVFDGLMAYRNGDEYYLHCADEHLMRFRGGAARMGLTFPWSVAQMLEGIHRLLGAEPAHDYYIRPIAYRRHPELWVTGSQDRPVDVSIFLVRVTRGIETTIRCHLSPIERISSRAIPGQTKVSGAYVNSFHARRTAEQAGYDDAIMLDREGRVAEASAANFFAIRGERLITPKANPDVFPGVTRRVVLHLGRQLGVTTEECDLRPSCLHDIDGAFLCSTLMEVRAISALDERQLATSESAVYRAVVRAFRKITDTAS